MRSGPLAASGVRKTATPTVAPALQPLQRRPDWPSSLESRPAGTVTEPGIHHATLLVVRSPAAIATRTASLTASALATAGGTSGTMAQRDLYPHPTLGTGAGNVQVLEGLLAETEPLGLPGGGLGALRGLPGHRFLQLGSSFDCASRPAARQLGLYSSIAVPALRPPSDSVPRAPPSKGDPPGAGGPRVAAPA